ncbi:hypothetical protein LdCL_310010700 [Leishmania donovani]|uniref:Uncharacterized protein n=1 Tax=Leishmania donovani TaxID=5661 RepID=A0A3S7X488_LEIDO|nr:hypothetical protein LdCL_310010700 [Leishmania donovani]
MPGSGSAGPKSRPEMCRSPNMEAAKTTASSSEAPTTNSATAATRGSRRAQGWHLAVGGGAPPGTAGANHSALDAKMLGSSGANSGIALRSSVQFSKDTRYSQNSPSVPRVFHGAASDEAADFRQNMADFLTVMYGDKTASGVVGIDEKSVGAPHAKGKAFVAESGIPAALLAAESGPLPRVSSSGGVSPGSKGPLVKGLTANSRRHSQGDHIDTLVESLVRAYSRRTTSARGEFQGTTGPDDDRPITYNVARQTNYCRTQASPRLSRGNGVGAGSGHNHEVSVFVSQAMGNILSPGGIRGQGAVSNRSILSSLGLDRNLFNLMPFQTRSNLENVTEEDSDTLLEPVYVGKQAMFRSVGTRPNISDISVSKSMRGVMSSAPRECGKNGHRNTTQVPLRGDSGGPRRSSGGTVPLWQRQGLGRSKQSLDSVEVMDKSRVNQRGGSGAGGSTKNRNATLSMSLDSKALGKAGGADEEDDSWSDEPAGILATKVMEGESPAIVSSARSLLDYCKTRADVTLQKALGALQDEEQLKRDVVIAVEHQLCVYIHSLERAERPKKGGGAAGISDRRKGSGEKSANSNLAAEREEVTSGEAGAGGYPSNCDTINSEVAPLTGNVMDFLQESTAGANRSKSLKSASMKM